MNLGYKMKWQLREQIELGRKYNDAPKARKSTEAMLNQPQHQDLAQSSQKWANLPSEAFGIPWQPTGV